MIRFEAVPAPGLKAERVVFELPDDPTRDDLLESFERFLLAQGYALPEGAQSGTLDWAYDAEECYRERDVVALPRPLFDALAAAAERAFPSIGLPGPVPQYEFTIYGRRFVVADDVLNP